jgi:hypothetical protein
MFTWMRTHQRKLMLVITILTIIAFAFLYDYTDRNSGAGGRTQIAQVYGRDLTVEDFRRENRKFELALELGLSEYASLLSAGDSQSEISFVINRLVIDHEGRSLGIDPDDAEIVQGIAALPSFQTGGQFDKKKYDLFVSTVLGPKGFTEREIQDLVRSSIIMNRIKNTIEAAPAVAEAEVNYVSRMFQPVSGVAVLFELAEFTKQVKVSDAEIEATFKGSPQRFVTPELRTVRYVRFPIPADVQKLEGKAKIDAQQKLANTAQTFFLRAGAAGFEKAAQEAKMKVETTLPFDATGGLPSLKALGNSGNVNVSGPIDIIAPAAFVLTKEKPISRVLVGQDEFVVAELGEVTPSRPMTLAEARPEITTELTDAAAKAALQKAAAAAVAKLRDAAKSGQSAAQAATAAGLKSQPFTNVSITDDAAAMDQRRYVQDALVVNEREITGLRDDGKGGNYVVWLEKRGPADPKKMEENRKEIVEGITAQRKRVLWMEWLSSAQKEAGIVFPGAPRG